MKITPFNTTLIFLYLAGFTVLAIAIFYGYSYYMLPLVERPYAQLHFLFKPGGNIGHGLGIVGSIMLLLLFLYSARKRELFGLRFGQMRNWLNIHIFFGICGPLLITLHTSFKFNGIVSISYYAMIAVALSGILGRYVYMQIPRTVAGEALTREQITQLDRHLTKKLIEQFELSPALFQDILAISGTRSATKRHAIAVLFVTLFHDVKRPFLFRKLKKNLRARNMHLSPRAFKTLLFLAKQKSLLLRKQTFIDAMNEIFHYWHVIHRPFAYVMIIIMFIHIAVAVAFGYRWLF